MNTSTDYNPISSNSYSSGSNEGSSNWFFFSFQTWIIIILILSFLGINVFIYLGNGVEQITKFLRLKITTVSPIQANRKGSFYLYLHHTWINNLPL